METVIFILQGRFVRIKSKERIKEAENQFGTKHKNERKKERVRKEQSK